MFSKSQGNANDVNGRDCPFATRGAEGIAHHANDNVSAQNMETHWGWMRFERACCTICHNHTSALT
eukprot:5964137-Amphidinium_carterae.1